MVKKYVPGETKDQRKARKEAEKSAKEQKVVEPNKAEQQTTVVQIPKELKNVKNYVVCLKHGTKYGSQYVNTLYNMVRRHTTVPYEFVCFTDDVRGIDEHIRTIRLQEIGVHGWWYKVMFFDKNFPLEGNLLYFDLDIVIHDNIDKLFTYDMERFTICRDFNRSLRYDWSYMNSSVFRMKSRSLGYVYDNFFKEHAMHMRRFHGDQDWIHAQISPEKGAWSFWPDNWIRSYKWEMRDRNDLQKINGVRNFTTKGVPKIGKQSCIAVFHGEPHPHQCKDDWVIENWK